MWVAETILVAIGMYSSVPVPQLEWNEKNMRYSLAAFPLVGLLQGLAFWGICVASHFFELPMLLQGAVLCVMPALLTGGIHLDGYADTCDALASHAPPERKQEILRDPHCGAFALIRLCIYFILYFSLCCVWDASPQGCLRMGLSFMLSRAVSGLLLTVMPIAKGSSLAKLFANAASRGRARVVLAMESALLLAALICLGAEGVAMVCAICAVSLFYAQTALHSFGGTSGDLAGWFLVKAEFWMLAASVLVQELT